MTLEEYRERYRALVDYYFDSLEEVDGILNFVSVQHHFNDSLHLLQREFLNEFLGLDEVKSQRH